MLSSFLKVNYISGMKNLTKPLIFNEIIWVYSSLKCIVGVKGDELKFDL